MPALSVAISRNGQFVFDQGFGFNQGFRFGNVKDMGPTDMSSLFRIADVTMPITSVAIFTLIEQGKLNLTDKVFGASRHSRDQVWQESLQAIRDGYHGGPSSHPHLRRLAGRFDRSNVPDNSWDQAKLIGWTLENLPLC